MAESRLFLLRKLWIVHTLPAYAESKLGNNRSWKTNPATHKNVRSKSDHVRSTQLEIVCFESAMPGTMFSKHSASGKLLAVVINRSLSAARFTGRIFEHEFAPIPAMPTRVLSQVRWKGET